MLQRFPVVWRGFEVRRLLSITILVPCLVGCGISEFINRDPQEEAYKKAETLPPLEVPPDLTNVQGDEALLIPGKDDPSVSSQTSYSDFERNKAAGAGGLETSDAAATVKSGADSGDRLALAQDFPRAWREVGMALGAAKVEIEDRDRSRGVYFVRYPPKPEKRSLTSRLKFWAEDAEAQQVMLVVVSQAGEAASQVAIFDAKEEQLLTTPLAKRLLDELRLQLH